MHGADVSTETRGVCVFRDGDENLDVVGCAAALELGFGLEGGQKMLCSLRGHSESYLEHIFDPGSGV